MEVRTHKETLTNTFTVSVVETLVVFRTMELFPEPQVPHVGPNCSSVPRSQVPLLKVRPLLVGVTPLSRRGSLGGVSTFLVNFRR